MLTTSGSNDVVTRPRRREAPVSSSFARRNRVPSNRCLTNARVTRTPAICSRSTRLTSSTRDCTAAESGCIRRVTTTTTVPSTGIRSTISRASGTSWRTAITTPPTAMTGTETASVSAERSTLCTCWTSFELRVTSEATPKRCISGAANRCTWRKSALRMSRPTAADTRVLRYTSPAVAAP